jgi:anti-sigma factor RsiW
MSHMFCTYQANRAETLVAYLYEDMDSAERAAFEAHIAGCPTCREELAELDAVRAQLARWTPPEPARPFAYRPSPPGARTRLGKTLGDSPAWAQVAAAMLVLGISAGVANLNVTYDSDGLTIRTGWQSGRSSGVAAPDPTARQATAAGVIGGDAAPWRDDLAALAQELRTELRASSSPAAAATHVVAQDGSGQADAAVLRRLRALVEESERRQQRELALRVAEIARDVQAQRRADLERIDRNLGVIQNSTGFEVMRQRQLLNSLAVRVSSQR